MSTATATATAGMLADLHRDLKSVPEPEALAKGHRDERVIIAHKERRGAELPDAPVSACGPIKYSSHGRHGEGSIPHARGPRRESQSVFVAGRAAQRPCRSHPPDCARSSGPIRVPEGPARTLIPSTTRDRSRPDQRSLPTRSRDPRRQGRCDQRQRTPRLVPGRKNSLMRGTAAIAASGVMRA